VAALYDPRRDQGLVACYSTDPGASGLAFLALVLWVSGFPEQARRTSRNAIRAALELEHANTTCHVRLFAGAHLAELLRDAPAAEAEADAVIALATEHRLPSWQNRGRILRGWALGQKGRVQDGLALVRQGMSELDRLGTSWHRPHQVALLGELYARAGDPAAGLRLVLDEAHEQVRRTGEGFWAADLHRVEGRLRRLTGAPADQVEACFEAALSLARQQGAKSYELRAATSLARLRRDQGRRREALDTLAPVHAWFTEGLDTPDLKDAEALLAELR
jgi:predicted ATPase